MTFCTTETISELVDDRVGVSSGEKGRYLVVLGNKPSTTLKVSGQPRTYGFEKEL